MCQSCGSRQQKTIYLLNAHLNHIRNSYTIIPCKVPLTIILSCEPSFCHSLCCELRSSHMQSCSVLCMSFQESSIVACTPYQIWSWNQKAADLLAGPANLVSRWMLLLPSKQHITHWVLLAVYLIHLRWKAAFTHSSVPPCFLVQD